RLHVGRRSRRDHDPHHHHPRRGRRAYAPDARAIDRALVLGRRARSPGARPRDRARSTVMSAPVSITTPTDTQILIVRTFDAPRALVWRTLSEPELVRRWWGLARGEMIQCDIDFRVGGTWRFVQRFPDGQVSGQSGEYVEIAKPER